MATNFKEVYIVFPLSVSFFRNGYEDEDEEEYIPMLPTFITESEYEAEEQALMLVDEDAESSTFIKFRQYENGKLEEVTGFNERYF